METNINDRVCDLNDPMFLKNSVIFRLKGMCDHLTGTDKCTVCEAIHLLEQPTDTGSNGSMWMVLMFALIFSGFGGNSSLFDLGTMFNILNETISKSKESNEEESK